MWTDQQELELERQQRSRLIQKVNDIKATIEQHTDRKATIGNIGITYNNRMVEFYQNCARCNISYIQSSLRRVISSYLMDVVINAINELQDYINCFDIKIDETNVQEEASKILSQANPKLQEYEKLSDEVFSFDINKDIVKAVEKDIEIHEQIEKDGGYNFYSDHPESIIEQYNRELEALGMTTRIPSSVIENIKHKGNNADGYEESHSEIDKIDYSAIKQDIIDTKKFLEQYNEELKSLENSEIPIVQNEDEDNYHR